MQRRILLKAASCAPALYILPAVTLPAAGGATVDLDIRQSPLNTTLLGVVHGVADYFDLNHSDGTLFGATGHGFLINLNDVVEPACPYIWNRSHFYRLAVNLGIEFTDLGFYSGQTPPAERASVEAILRKAIAEGVPCSLINMENQLITGYDETGFHTAGPWPKTDFPPRRLTFGSWEELGSEIHLNFFVIRKVAPASRDVMVRHSLEYAVDLIKHPTHHSTHASLGIAQDAYDNWLTAIDRHGASHGNWWNATVWGECRKHAGEYMKEVAGWFPATADHAEKLAIDYADIAAGLIQAADRELPAADKKELVARLKTRELATLQQLEDILSILS